MLAARRGVLHIVLALLVASMGLFVLLLVLLNPAGNLVLEEASLADTPAGSEIQGRVANRTNRAYADVRASFAIFDAEGNDIGSASLRRPRLAAGEVWNFSLQVATSAARIEGNVSSPENVWPNWLGGCTSLMCR